MTAKIIGEVDIPEHVTNRALKADFCCDVVRNLVPGRAMLIEFSSDAEMLHYRSMFSIVTTNIRYSVAGVKVSAKMDHATHQMMVWLQAVQQ